MPAGGRKGNRGGGRPGHGLDEKIKTLKITLILAVLKDCEENPRRKLYWAERFVNRLMPQTVEGNGQNGEITMQLVGFEYVKPQIQSPD